MLSSLIQVIGLAAVLAFAGGFVVAVFASLSRSRASVSGERLRRVRTALFRIATVAFALVIFLTLIDFMLRAMNDS